MQTLSQPNKSKVVCNKIVLFINFYNFYRLFNLLHTDTINNISYLTRFVKQKSQFNNLTYLNIFSSSQHHNLNDFE